MTDHDDETALPHDGMCAGWIWAEPPSQRQPRAVRYGGIKVHTYTPDAFSWAPSLHEWWLCRQHGPYLIPLAGIAQRQCDPWAFAPTFSLLGFDHLRNVFAAEDKKKDEKKGGRISPSSRRSSSFPVTEWVALSSSQVDGPATFCVGGEEGGEKRTNELALKVEKTPFPHQIARSRWRQARWHEVDLRKVASSPRLVPVSVLRPFSSAPWTAKRLSVM